MKRVMALGLLCVLGGCGEDDPGPPEGCDVLLVAGEDDQERVQTALIEARIGDVLCFEDEFALTDELSLTSDGVTLRGYGRGGVFDFTTQTSGANGIHVDSVSGVTIEDLTVRDPKGDGIRFTACEDVVVRRTKVLWTADEPSDENGAYGLYPVTSNRVLIENCEVQGSSDAGIYVGQSQNIVVRNNVVQRNVAGIEIENSTHAEVYENEAFDNTGGILVFDLPSLPAGAGSDVLVRDNDIHENNRLNFATEGTIVSFVPPGVGVLILAMDRVEVKNNDIREQDTTGVLVVAYGVVAALGAGSADDPDYDQYPETVYIHDNEFDMVGGDPAMVLAPLMMNPMPQVVWDGLFDAEKDNSDGALSLCVDDATFVDANFTGGFMHPSNDLDPHDCRHDPIASVDLSALEED